MLKKLFFGLFKFVAAVAVLAICVVLLVGNIEGDGGKTFLKTWTVINDGARAAQTGWNNIDRGVRALVADIAERSQQGEADAVSDRSDEAPKKPGTHHGKRRG